MPTYQKNMTGQDYIDLFLRRKWWLLVPLIAATLIAAAYSYSIPPIYRSSTLILVERAKAPEGYVQPTVTSTVQERLNTISQQVTSRTNLEKIIKKFKLFNWEPDPEIEAGFIGPWLTPLRQQLLDLSKLKQMIMSSSTSQAKEVAAGDNETSTLSLEDIVNRMTKNIEVKVIGKDAFTIAYSGREPALVMDITNTLAALFIEENLKAREEEAAETSKFLETELAEAEKELATKERDLKEFKTTHMGALPDQLDVNLRTLDHLRKELSSTNDAIKVAEDSLHSLDDVRFFSKKFGPDGKSEITLNPLLAKRASLMEELAKLQAEFNENYPDIIVIKKQISDIEAALMEGSSPSGSSAQIGGIQHQKVQSRTQAIKSEIASLREKQKRTLSQIREYEKRVEETFSNEQKLSTLVRDYNIAQGHYAKLLEKRLNAKSSENLEKWQKMERFRIVDPANLPENPYKPDRRKIILLGSLCGGGLGVGVIFLREYRHPSFRKPEDFHGIVDAPTLVTIPRNKAARRGDHQLVALKEQDSIMTDQYRVLYTKINQLSRKEAHTVFAISSPIKGEGKTMTALNLAIVTARDFGKKTLLMEGDLKKPMLSYYLNIQSHEGLVDVLLERSDLHSTLMSIGHDNLSVLPAGKRLQNSCTLLSSQQMKDLIKTLKDLFNVIFIDSPPILPLPDMNIFEEVVDSIILVVRAESTPKTTLITAIDSLATQKLLGVVLNDAKQPLASYYRYTYQKV